MTEAEANVLFNEVVGRVQYEIGAADKQYGISAAQRAAAEQFAHRSAWLLLESLKAKGVFK